MLSLLSFISLIFNCYGQELTFLKGKVTLSDSKNGKSKELTKGDKIPFGSFLKTQKESFAIITFPEGSTLKIDPDSEVEISQLEVDQENEKDKKTTNVFYLLKGAILSKFIGGPERELIIESEHIALAVRGTEFFFGEEGDQYFAAVNEGEVAVVKKDNYDHESLEAGKSLVIENKKTLTLPAAYLWAKKLSWGKSKVTKNSGFNAESVRSLRRKELKNKLKNLRLRKKKIFKGRFKERMKRAFVRRKSARMLMKNKLKKTKVQNSSRKQKVQQFRKKMRKRGILRRRRN